MKQAKRSVMALVGLALIFSTACPDVFQAQEPTLIELTQGRLLALRDQEGVFSVTRYVLLSVDKKSARYQDLKQMAKNRPAVMLLLQVPAAEEYNIPNGEIAIVGPYEKTVVHSYENLHRDYQYMIGDFRLLGLVSHLEPKIRPYRFDTARLIIRKAPD